MLVKGFYLSIVLCFIILSVSGQPEINNPGVRWRFQTDGPVRGAALVTSDQVVAGSSDGALYSIDKSSGRLLWKFQTSGAITSSPALAGNLVIFSSRDNFIYGVNLATGKETWKFKMGELLPYDWHWEYYMCAPVVDGKYVYQGSGDGNLYCLSVETGKLVWKYQTSKRLRATPLLNRGVLYQPGYDGVIHAVDQKSGMLLWKFETEGATYNSKDFGWDRNSIDSSPTIKDSLLVVGSRDGNTYCVNTKTRKLEWKFTYGPTWAMSGAVIDNDLAFIGWSDNFLLSAIELSTGKERWKFEAGSLVYSTPLIAKNNLIVGSADHKLYCLDKRTGEKKWTFSTDGSILSSPKADDKTLFIGSDDGALYALEEHTKALLAVYHPVPKNKREQNLFVSDDKITTYLKERGFEQLDSAKLHKFLIDRLADKRPSVIVFAFQRIPENLIGANPAQGLVRKYLEDGGKIIWPGAFPNMYRFNAKGKVEVDDGKTAADLLDIELTNINESGNYFAKSTPEGKNWGLPAWLTATYAVVNSKGVTPLALDEYGRPVVWRKQYNENPHAGFVACRPWGWYTPLTEDALAMLYRLAMYGLE